MIITEIYTDRTSFECINGRNNLVYISIYDNGDRPAERLGEWHDGITVEFDDAEEWNEYSNQLMTLEQAGLIIEKALLWHRSPLDLILYVHCNAGHSRSPAIVKFIRDYITNKINHDLEDHSHYNRYVYETLKKANMLRLKSQRQ